MIDWWSKVFQNLTTVGAISWEGSIKFPAPSLVLYKIKFQLLFSIVHIDSPTRRSKMNPMKCKMCCQSISYCSSRSRCTNILERGIFEIQPSFILYLYLIIINVKYNLTLHTIHFYFIYRFSNKNQNEKMEKLSYHTSLFVFITLK